MLKSRNKLWFIYRHNVQTLESKQIKIELLGLADSIKTRLECLIERLNIANNELDKFKIDYLSITDSLINQEANEDNLRLDQKILQLTANGKFQNNNTTKDVLNEIEHLIVSSPTYKYYEDLTERKGKKESKDELENEIRFIERRIESLNRATKILPDFIQAYSQKCNETITIQLTEAISQLLKASKLTSIADFFNRDMVWLMSNIERLQVQFTVHSKLSAKKKMKAYSDAKKAIRHLIAQLDEVANQNRGHRLEPRFISSHIEKLEIKLDTWSLKSETTIGRPNQKNAERLFMATKLKKYFKVQYGKPFNSVVLAVINVFYKDNKLSVNEIARIKV